jgi:hypothetical protein
MGSHQALPKLAVIGHGEMQEFVNDDVIGQLAVEFEQFAVEVQVAWGQGSGGVARSRGLSHRLQDGKPPASKPPGFFRRSSHIRRARRVLPSET